jgi:predicted neuraminidase
MKLRVYSITEKGKMKKIVTVMTVFALVLSMLSSMIFLARAQTNGWSEPQQLTTDPSDDFYASIMQDSDGKIWLVWCRNPNLWFETSSDGGISWSMPEILVPDAWPQGGTSLLQDSTGRIWVAWSSGRYSPPVSWDIYYITSDNSGLSWSTPQQLTNYPGDDNIPSLIEVSGEVWVVFRSYGLSWQPNIWYRKTSDGGATWSPPIQLTSGTDYTPDAMVDSSGKIWVVWPRWMPDLWHEDIYCRTSVDNGASWSADQQLTSETYIETHPALLEDASGKIFLFYSYADRDTGGSSIRYRTTDDSGQTWSSYKELISDEHTNTNPEPTLVNGEIWVTWESDRSGNMDIWLTKASLKIVATIDIDPSTLNLESKGKWITGYIELPEGHDAEDIDVSTILLNGTVPVDPNAPTAVGDYDGDGVEDLMAKFDRAAVSGLMLSQDITSGNVVLTITGRLYDGTMLQGSDTIRVMLPMPKSHRSVPI